VTDIRLHYGPASMLLKPLPGESAVIRFADEVSLLAPILDINNVRGLMPVIANDASDDFGLVKAPSRHDAKRIIRFAKDAIERKVPNLVVQCQAGVGRSQAVIAALCKMLGRECGPILKNGTYNRKLYGLMLAELGIPNPQPLVSVVVRVKYDLRSLSAFTLSLEKQRYGNCEVICVTDGPRPDIDDWGINPEGRFKIIRTPVAKGRWGHPYRQLGIDAAQGEYLILANDDNYLCPGFIEQLLYPLEHEACDISCCKIAHAYSGWGITSYGSDLCGWMAKAELVKRHPWTGVDFDSDAHYLQELVKDFGSERVSRVDRVLVVKN